MRDIETGSEWSHLLGQAMAGELKGQKLKPMVSDMLTWSAWKRDFPATTVLNMKRTAKNYSSDFYGDPKRFVFGFQIDGQTKVLPMEALLAKPVHNLQVGRYALLSAFDKDGTAARLFDSTVAGRQLTFESVDEATMRDLQTGSLWNIRTGESYRGPMSGTKLRQRVGIMSFRKAWQAFHPESEDISF